MQTFALCFALLQGIFDQFERELSSRSIRSKSVPVQPRADDHGIVGKQHDYEGGFVLIAMQHSASATAWHGAGL